MAEKSANRSTASDAALRPEMKVATEDPEQLVVFRLGGETCGVRLQRVQDILPAAGDSGHSKSSDVAPGIVRWRERVVPVLDLPRRFAPPTGKAAADGPIVIGDLGNQKVGIKVDSVLEVSAVPAAPIASASASISSKHAGFVAGSIRVGETSVTLLDLDRILLQEEREQLRIAGEVV